MARRKKAFVTLAVSLLIGLILTLIKFVIANVWISIISVFVLALILVFFAFMFSLSFDFLLKMKISLTDQYLQRDNGKKVEDFLIADITKINIKRTTGKTIREIKIVFTNGTNVCINALDNFEQFKDDLVKKISVNVVKNEFSEPIDFDHPLFYVVVGALVSFLSTNAIRFLVNLDYRSTIIFYVIFSVYLLIWGIYFVLQKPISQRYGNKTVKVDYIIGLLMVLAGLGIFLIRQG